MLHSKNKPKAYLHLDSRLSTTGGSECISIHAARPFCVYLHMAVLSLAGIAADGLGLRPGFEHLSERTGDWQTCHADPI